MCILFIIAFTAGSAQVRAYPPHADVPLNPMLYSIDDMSPTVVPPVTPADILMKPGPLAAAPAMMLGLTPFDELDGISGNEGALTADDVFVFVFGESCFV